MAAQGGDIFKKILQLFKLSKRAPPPPLGDGKYDSEEDGLTLKAGILKELGANQRKIPAELDLLLDPIRLAKAGGNTSLETVRSPVILC
jgi:hypothetical protein